jgi:hypothetical protein
MKILGGLQDWAHEIAGNYVNNGSENARRRTTFDRRPSIKKNLETEGGVALRGMRFEKDAPRGFRHIGGGSVVYHAGTTDGYHDIDADTRVQRLVRKSAYKDEPKTLEKLKEKLEPAAIGQRIRTATQQLAKEFPGITDTHVSTNTVIVWYPGLGYNISLYVDEAGLRKSLGGSEVSETQTASVKN